MLKKNILFIVNPISGGKKKVKIPALINAHLDASRFNAVFHFTTHIGHAAEIAAEAVKDFDIIVAVGGDGTINEIAGKVMYTDKVLGIIPFGSGNGLARSLKIPMQTVAAIKLLNKQKVDTIDTARLNDRYFFNMAGMGFDAHISSVFANNKRRGLMGYIEMGLKEMIAYKPQVYQLEIDGQKHKRVAFAISLANSAQYGNNVYIAPNSSLTDGLLDVCIVKHFPRYKLPLLAYQMLKATTDRSALVEIIQGKKINIIREKPDAVHVDGEPFMMQETLEAEVYPLSLKVIIGNLAKP